MTDYLEIEGRRIACTRAGPASKPPILLLHGIMSHRGVWLRTLDALQDDFHCVAIDHLGFGDSDKPRDEDYSIPKQAERALQVADHFGFERFTLIGHSMGGQAATWLAASLAPQRVHKLVSVAGVVTGELSKRAQNFTYRTVLVGDKFPALYSLSLALTRIAKPFACFVFRPWFHDICNMPYQAWEADRRNALNKDIAHTTPKAWAGINAADLTPVLKGIRAPALVIFGKQDGTVPVAQAHIFKEQLPSAQLIVLDPCGHFPMYEKFDAYIEPLARFLQRQP